MYCNRCGNRIKDGAMFCEACGASVADMMPESTVGTSAVGTTAMDAATPAQATDPMEQQVPGGEPGGRRLPPAALITLVASAIVIMAVAIGLVHHFLITPTQESGEAQLIEGQTTASGQTTGDQGTGGSGNTSNGASAPPVSENQGKVDGALASGAQVFTGTVHVTTYSQRQDELGLPASTGFSGTHKTLVLLLFDQEIPVTARHWGSSGEDLQTRDTSSIALGTSYASFDGQRVTAAIHAEDMGWPTDVTGALYGAGVAEHADILFTGIDDSVVISSPSSAPSGSGASSVAGSSSDFILPDSNTRVYPVSELRDMGLSKSQLRIARNEIYARHGRGFKDADLQSYFDSKSWYTKRHDADRFDESQLSSTERTNIDNIKKAES